MSEAHTTTVNHSNNHASAWAQCSCGWLGPVRRGADIDAAYDDQDVHLTEGHR